MGRETKRTRPPFARNAAARAKSLKITWEDLATKAGLPLSTVRAILAGKSFGRERNRIAIAEALQTTVGELYRGAGSRQRPTSEELKHLIESKGEYIRAEAILPVMDEFLCAPSEIRAAVLATLYDDIGIAKPYLDKVSAQLKGSLKPQS